MKRIGMLLWLIVFSMAVLSLACAEDVHTHEYSDWQVKTPATCSSEGEEVRICATCGNVESRKIAATGNHSYSDWYIKDAPTCGDDGLEVRICADCGNVESRKIAASGNHSFSSWHVKTAATCASTGVEVRICADCGNVESRDIPQLPHTEAVLPGKAATCTESGLTDGVKCSVCGEIIKAQEVIEATGHAEETISGKAATCTENGLTDGVKCSVCGEIIVAQKAIPAAGHAYQLRKVAATSTSRGYTLHTCTVCGDSYKDQYTSKLSAPAPTATPAAEDADGSIVTDQNREAAAYTSDAAQEGLLIITAESGELRNLHLSLALLEQLKAEGIEQLRFVVGDAALTIPLSAFAQDDVALILADIGKDASGYVITLDPSTTTADGQPGCLVQAVIATLDGEETDITSFLQGLALTLDGQQLDVLESTVYAYDAA